MKPAIRSCIARPLTPKGLTNYSTLYELELHMNATCFNIASDNRSPLPIYLNSDKLFLTLRDWYYSPKQDLNLGPNCLPLVEFETLRLRPLSHYIRCPKVAYVIILFLVFSLSSLSSLRKQCSSTPIGLFMVAGMKHFAFNTVYFQSFANNFNSVW